MPKQLLKRYLPDPAKVRNIQALHFLGDKLFSPNLWHLNRRSVSRAMAVGLWAMYTPPLPLQQVIAAIGAIYCSANLPIAVALVWITNPLTWIPLYYVAYKPGHKNKHTLLRKINVNSNRLLLKICNIYML